MNCTLLCHNNFVCVGRLVNTDKLELTNWNIEKIFLLILVKGDDVRSETGQPPSRPVTASIGFNGLRSCEIKS